MVDALDAVVRAVHAGGWVVDLQPDAATAISLSLSSDRTRWLGRVLRPRDDDVHMAHAMIDRFVDEGRLELVGRERRNYWLSFRSLSELDRYCASGSVPWRFAPGSRAAVTAALRARRERDLLAMRRAYTITVLRRPRG